MNKNNDLIQNNDKTKEADKHYIMSAYFSFKHELLMYESPKLILKETEKTYITQTGRYLKKDENKAISKISSNFPEITVFIVDGSHKDLKNKVAEWFKEKASYIEKQR